MNRSVFIRPTTGLALAMVFFSGLADDARPHPASAPGVVEKVEQAVVRGVSAAASGVQRGAAAAAKGIQTGAHAAAKGVSRAASATSDAVEKTARKIGIANEPAGSSASAPTGGK